MKASITPLRESTTDSLADVLMANLEAFRGFARRRTGDEELAADAVQESLMRALKSEGSMRNREDLIAWFYRILRNVLTDLHRRKVARARAMERLADEPGSAEQSASDFEASACQCFRSLLTTMKPNYARVIEICDLDGESSEEASRNLGISRNNLKVRLHRGRAQLRTLLEKTCKLCASHGCLDCDCDHDACIT